MTMIGGGLVITVGIFVSLFLSNGEHGVQAFISVPAASTLTTRNTITTTDSAATSTRLPLSSEVAVKQSEASSSSSKSSSPPPPPSNSSSPSTATSIDKFMKPPRVIPEDPALIPTLYNYDHCPFCVRVRLALGFKNVKHNLVFLANDDVVSPTALVGKKIAPIMRFPREKETSTNNEGNEDYEEDLIMMESMEIIEYIESDERFGPTNILRPASGRTDLKEWQKKCATAVANIATTSLRCNRFIAGVPTTRFQARVYREPSLATI